MTTRREIEDVVTRRLTAGESPEDISRKLTLDTTREYGPKYLGSPCPPGHAIVLPGWVADDGNDETDIEMAGSGREAAELYVEAGDWEIGDEVLVRAWREALVLDERGEVCLVRLDDESYTIEIGGDES